jgi:glycosyltransferase involved in cell wall biosynthesis
VFTGALADPRPAYAAADIVIGMGGSAARALAFGKPLIVVGERGWFRTLTPDTSAMLFRNSFWSDDVQPEPAEALVHLIRDLAGKPSERARLGDYGRGFAEANFGLEAMARRLATVYREALADRHVTTGWFADLPVEMGTIAAQLRGRPA